MPSPKKGVAYDFPLGLIDSATGAFKEAPTLATGDFKVSKDYGAFVNLATLPEVLPAGGRSVKVSLSATEFDADKLTIEGIDVAGAEWDDIKIFIDVTTANIDDVVRSATPANTLNISLTGEADSNVQSINNVTIVGDGSATRFNV